MLGSLNNIDLIRWEQYHCYRPCLEVLDLEHLGLWVPKRSKYVQVPIFTFTLET